MEEELIGWISATLVILSAVPYAIRTYQGKIKPNLTSWSLWTLIGMTLLLTYDSSGAGWNVLPAIFGFFNPLIITVLALSRRGKWYGFNKVDKICLILGLISLGMWFVMKEEQLLAQYALYIAILADLCAAIPTLFFVWRQPAEDRPIPWALYAVGYGLAIFAIEDHTFANYILPLYMFSGALLVSLPLVLYRWKTKKPIIEWV